MCCVIQGAEDQIPKGAHAVFDLLNDCHPYKPTRTDLGVLSEVLSSSELRVCLRVDQCPQKNFFPWSHDTDNSQIRVGIGITKVFPLVIERKQWIRLNNRLVKWSRPEEC